MNDLFIVQTLQPKCEESVLNLLDQSKGGRLSVHVLEVLLEMGFLLNKSEHAIR